MGWCTLKENIIDGQPCPVCVEQFEAMQAVVDAAREVNKVWRDAYGTTPNEIVLERRLDDLDAALCAYDAVPDKSEGG
jgi:hypothetical protein